jgi:hypothetical protein
VHVCCRVQQALQSSEQAGLRYKHEQASKQHAHMGGYLLGVGPPVPKAYKGATWLPDQEAYQFDVHFPNGGGAHLGHFTPAQAKHGAEAFDLLQLLIYGPFADTNFKWSHYTQENVAAAAAILSSGDVNLHAIIVLARLQKGEWLAVEEEPQGCWRASVSCKQQGEVIDGVVCSQGGASAEEAARDADRGLLVVEGLGCTTNFPASSYSAQELEEAGWYAMGVGVDPERVENNLEAVEQV